MSVRRCSICDGEAMPEFGVAHQSWCPKIVYPRGTRVRLVHTNDIWTKLDEGMLGTVGLVDDTGTVHVAWDDGSQLGMIAEAGDRIEVVR